MKTLISVVLMVLIFSACRKQDLTRERFKKSTDSIFDETYVSGIKANLKDSLSSDDYDLIDFTRVFKSKDIRTPNYFLRLGIIDKPLQTDFILLSTDKSGNIIRGKIIHVVKNFNQKRDKALTKTSFVLTSLSRKNRNYIGDNNGDNWTSREAPVGEPTLPDCVVISYIYPDYNMAQWYLFDALVGIHTTATGTYTYGNSNPEIHGGGGPPVDQDQTLDISYENFNLPAIDIAKYLKCFSTLSNQGAQFKITIFTDLPVNGDPSKLFNFSTGDCGHTFIQLSKSNGGQKIQQNIGFYPSTGWKSIEANAPVASKLVDNAGHEFNASLTVSTDASHFQNALNEIQYESKSKYDIDNFNCTDFALNVFNIAAPILLTIPQYHIPGGMVGEVSNTPQGLFNELSELSKTGGYGGYGNITIPGVAGYTGVSHGACD